LWARWAAYQSNRAEDAGTESGFITRAALDYTLRMFYDDQMQEAYDEVRDPVAIMRDVVGESWVYQQVCTFELRGMQEFLDFIAEDALAENAYWARVWGDAEMRAVRVEGPRSGRLVVTDLSDGCEIELLDLGAGTSCEPGGHLIGRLVPSGVEPRTMFESTPLVVDTQTAREVAEAGTGGWITCLKAAIADGRMTLTDLESEDRELVTDVPSSALIHPVTRPADHERLRGVRQVRARCRRASSLPRPARGRARSVCRRRGAVRRRGRAESPCVHRGATQAGGPGSAGALAPVGGSGQRAGQDEAAMPGGHCRDHRGVIALC
jgi:hypothetical protein